MVTEKQLKVPCTRQAGAALPSSTKFQAMIASLPDDSASKQDSKLCFCHAWLAFN